LYSDVDVDLSPRVERPNASAEFLLLLLLLLLLQRSASNAESLRARIQLAQTPASGTASRRCDPGIS